ncbi:tetratricopeptide repeat protein [Roseospira marina]|nr:tetratricopeptide repeat protein [Roseospira marina]MBB4314727.1 tetratricopeptide (TPR) repeat protein [Roseospira marina]MBB5087716.1 tetratricopeptide (TPR) repeat protein [Roseospira marina]
MRSPARAALVAVGAALALTPAACAHPVAADGAAQDRTAVLATASDAVPPADAAEDAESTATTDDEDRPSGRALGQYLAGRTAQYANDISAAATHFSAALEADPGNTMLMRRAYYYLMADGRFDEAVDVAHQAVVAMSGEDFAPLLMATAAMRDGRPDQAVGWLWPLEPQGLNGLLQPLLVAWAHLGDGNLEDALRDLDPAREMVSARRLVDLHAALLADIGGDKARAATLIDAYLKDGPPDNARPLELMAMLLVHQGRTDEALEMVRTYIAGGPVPLAVTDLAARLEAQGAAGVPDLLTTPSDGFAEALYHIGLVVNQGQGSDTAIVLMRMALAVKPDFPRAALGIAETLRRMERFEAANAVLDGIDSRDDAALDYVVQLYRAENLERLDRIDEALAHYDALAEAHPEQVEPLVDKGDLLRRADRFAAAADAYRVALTRLEAGETDPAAVWPILYRRGIAHERAGAWDAARADFERALELEPNQPEVLNYLGYSLMDRGENIEQALEMVREAVRQRPDDGYIVDSLGWGYYLLGRYDEAVEELERAVALRPQDWTINDHLGDAYWRVGRRTEARFQWERALSLEPREDAVPGIEEKLSIGLTAAGESRP